MPKPMRYPELRKLKPGGKSINMTKHMDPVLKTYSDLYSCAKGYANRHGFSVAFSMTRDGKLMMQAY